VLRTLAQQGSSFAVASRAEIDLCLKAGVKVECISFGNTIKKEADIAYAYQRGVQLFSFDSEQELEKLARAAPGVAVMCRVLVEGSGAQQSLSRKFGCSPTQAARLLVRAHELELDPAGVAFHLGSQQTEPWRWAPAIETAANVFIATAAAGVDLRLLNIGGGFPAHYVQDVPSLDSYALAIRAALSRSFGADHPQLIWEPGRSLVADAGVMRTEVVLVSRKPDGDGDRWIFIDVGRFGGLAETAGEEIRYRLRTNRDGGPTGPAILAGPTCDSVDILYERERYELPLDLAPSDVIDFFSTGAYTASYAAVGSNGFRPPTTYCVR
jgi:ornithine decarboxylase